MAVKKAAQGEAKKSMKKSHYKKKLALAAGAAAGIVGTAGWIAYLNGPAKKTTPTPTPTPTPRSKHVHFAPTTRKTLFQNISDWWYGASKSSKSKL
jgi:hypothetical protein